MNTTPLKNFAIQSRNLLRQGVLDRILTLGFDRAGNVIVSEPINIQGGTVFMDKILDDSQVDENGFVRMDDWEMRDDVQSVVAERWDTVSNDNVKEIADIDGYWEDFYNMFGFKIDGVDYSADVDIM